MNFLTSIAAIGILGATSAHAVLFNGFEYTLTMEEVTWEMAEAAADGGHVAPITSVEEQELLMSSFGTVGDLQTAGSKTAQGSDSALADDGEFDPEVFQLREAKDAPNDPTNESIDEMSEVWDSDWNNIPGFDQQFAVIKAAADEAENPSSDDLTDAGSSDTTAPTASAVNVPDTGSTLLLFGAGLAALVAAKKKLTK